jgi:hypothetical protein
MPLGDACRRLSRALLVVVEFGLRQENGQSQQTGVLVS